LRRRPQSCAWGAAQAEKIGAILPSVQQKAIKNPLCVLQSGFKLF
jgi:hypothetical protein